MTVIQGYLENIFYFETMHKSYRPELLKAPTPSTQDKGKNILEEDAPSKQDIHPDLPHVKPVRESDSKSVKA